MEPHNSSSVGGTSDPKKETKSMPCPTPSCVSMKSDWSMTDPIKFSTGEGTSVTWQNSRGGIRVLEKETGDLQQDSYIQVDDVLRVLETHKTSMKNKYESLFEGIQDNKTLLNRIYTQLYIIEGESEGVNEEHEVLQMEKTPRKQYLQDTPINCLDIFKPVQGPEGQMEEEDIRAEGAQNKDRKEGKGPTEQQVRTVLTTGIAGIGKTVSVHKFILDWAEGKANQEVDFMFVIPFRELNLIKNEQCSLHRLLRDFHPELRDLDLEIYNAKKVVFIFDGLDESRIPLNIAKCEKISDITVTSSVGEVMANLIKGELLPSALIWITSRPAAANQISSLYINRLTEIQGFTDPQKEEYFSKRISDQDQAKKIISHIKAAKSLHIMCHIPVFCWISATVLQQVMEQGNSDTPTTLTNMYAHFLLTQTNMKNEKYEEKDERHPQKLLESNRTVIIKLSELAFKQLMKGNVLFYEEDLRECSIGVTEASVYSGICTQIFREESVLYRRKVYCFVHLSFQEFLAAFYVFHCYMSKNMEALKLFLNVKSQSENVPLEMLLKEVADKVLWRENGHLDLFLRFLLGISLEPNQRILQGLLTQTQSSSDSIKETVQYIKHKIQTENLPEDRSINLFLCLTEVNDQSLSKELQDYLKSERDLEKKLSAAHCSAIAYILQMSVEVLDELDLKKYNTSLEGYKRLLPAVQNCRKALLSSCNLITSSSEAIFFALKSPNSYLKELDISNNNIQDSGLKLLSDGMKSSCCKLEILKAAICNLEEKTCDNLGSVLQWPTCNLKELDLSNNDLHDSGVKLLSAGLRTSHCKLEILRLSGCLVTDEGCFSLASALVSNPSYLKELDLTYNYPGDSGINLLSARVEAPHCKLETLKVEHAGKTRIKSGLRKYASKLRCDQNTAHPRLLLSEGNRKVTRLWEHLPYPEHPDRFDGWMQVLCRESLTGRCYWEAEWSGMGAAIAMTYKRIGRKEDGDECGFGYNDVSWTLNCTINGYSARHNNKSIDIAALSSHSNRVGVYLDWLAGTLSFYSVSSGQTPSHIYTFHSTFTEPLYAGLGFRFWDVDSSLHLCYVE